MFSLPTGTDIGLLSIVSKPVVRLTQCPIKRYWDRFRPGAKRQEVQADEAVLFCFELTNNRSCKETSLSDSVVALCLFNAETNSNFYNPMTHLLLFRRPVFL